MSLHYIPARTILCCDLDPSVYKGICSKHFFIDGLIHACLNSTLPLDDGVIAALKQVEGFKEAKIDGG